jgi:hypothetical protein
MPGTERIRLNRWRLPDIGFQILAIYVNKAFSVFKSAN